LRRNDFRPADSLFRLTIKVLDNEKDDNEAIYRAGIAIGNLVSDPSLNPLPTSTFISIMAQ
jgi:hypothetical protein